LDKRLNLLYFSATGCTIKIIKEISKGIGNTIKEYDITLPHNRQSCLSFKNNDLVIVGVPVYAGRVPSFLIDYLSKIKGNNTCAVSVVVYGNRDYDDALLELKNTLEERGFVVIAAGAFIGEHSKTRKVATGRPDSEDLKIAFNFGIEINEKLNSIIAYNRLIELTIKGQYPYKVITSKQTSVPTTSEDCVKCGICASYCPMGAIDSTNFVDVDYIKCIRCCSCIKRCPVHAKSINDEVFNNKKQHLIDNFSTVRKEPELFI
jgi:NAD-dependent dihydropyrimidine dehydrogenase PreA subunit